MDLKIALAPALALSVFALAACGGGNDASSDAPTAEAAASEASAPTAEAAAEPAAPAQPERLSAPEGSLAASEMVIGSPDAPLTVTEFASVTCPGCAAFHKSAFPAIKEQLIDTGEVRFVYKEFPTPPLKYAQAGFILARCAATESGPEAYFAMVDALYKTQSTWVYGDDSAGALRNIAAQAGIAGDDFDACFRRDDIRSVIIESIEQGRELNLTGTPSFIIDGAPITLRGTPEDIVAILKEEVAKRR
ncbi:MAG: DsbA family protein [Pseudomonadota bacterium]